MNKGFEVFEEFDLSHRHGMSNMTMGLFLIDELKNTFLWLVLGLPAYWIFMLLI
jgi:hypothetical protein